MLRGRELVLAVLQPLLDRVAESLPDPSRRHATELTDFLGRRFGGHELHDFRALLGTVVMSGMPLLLEIVLGHFGLKPLVVTRQTPESQDKPQRTHLSSWFGDMFPLEVPVVVHLVVGPDTARFERERTFGNFQFARFAILAMRRGAVGLFDHCAKPERSSERWFLSIIADDFQITQRFERHIAQVRFNERTTLFEQVEPVLIGQIISAGQNAQTSNVGRM